MIDFSARGASPVLLLEFWKPVIGFEGRYEVSNIGNICRLVRHQQYPAYGHLKPTLNLKLGYLQIYLRKDGITTTHYVHRIVAFAHLGLPPIGDYTVNHIGGYKRKNWVSNFEYLSRGDNLRHARALGIWCLGEQSVHAKLSESDVRRIRDLKKSMSEAELARMFNVGPAAIHKIVNHQRWKHVV